MDFRSIRCMPDLHSKHINARSAALMTTRAGVGFVEYAGLASVLPCTGAVEGLLMHCSSSYISPLNLPSLLSGGSSEPSSLADCLPTAPRNLQTYASAHSHPRGKVVPTATSLGLHKSYLCKRCVFS